MQTSFEELIDVLKKYVSEEKWYSVQALTELISEEATKRIEAEVEADPKPLLSRGEKR